jgi:hypothetical protein
VRRYLTLDDNLRALEVAPIEAKPTKAALTEAA